MTVKVDAHSELMGAYPWGFTGVAPNASDNLADTAAFDGRALVFREQGKLPHPNAETHDWAALVGSDRRPAGGETGAGHRGDQGDNVCTAEEPPSQCDDGPFGKGQGGQLRYEVRVKGHDSETVWVAVAGSDKGLRRPRSGAGRRAVGPRPRAASARSTRARSSAAGRASRCRVTAGSQDGIDWSKQNLADSTQVAENLQIRHVDQGRQYPPPAGTVRHVRFRGAGWPDYPWIFGTDGEYTAFASVALGQFETSDGPHARAARHLRDRQRRLGQGRARDRHRRLDLVRRPTRTPGTPTRP